jgi:hypothetical protein
MNDSWLDPPLRRDGTSRRERVLSALDPATAPVDGRRRGELLAYVCAIAAGVRWHRESQTTHEPEAAGDWQIFFERDPAVRIAALAHGAEPWSRKLFESLRSSAQAAVEAGAPQATLAQELLAVLKLLDVAFGVLAQRTSSSGSASPLESEIRSLIKETLVPRLEDFLALAEEGWFATVGFNAERSRVALFAWVWGHAELAGPTPEALASLVIDPVTVGGVLARLDAIHSELLAAAARLRQAALDAETRELAADGSHAPHVALLLAYLDAFAVLRSEVDRLTERHLRNYYGKRLAQTKLPVEPDRAHVVFTLARGETSAALSAGRELLAGTERFALLHDTIIDRTEIAALRSTYEASDGVVRIATEADSADGAGAALADPASGYDAFGHEALTQVAPLGFAIAAPSLLQTGGTKVVTLTIALSAPLPADLANPTRLKSGFRVEFTGKKGWVVADDVTATVGSDPTHFDLAFAVTADIAIVGLDTETHAVALGTTWPILRCTLDQQQILPTRWAGVHVKDITCSIVVIADANVVVVTDTGPANPQKPFQPFGPMPSVGSRFAIGSREVFSKRLTSLSVAVVWRDAPVDLASYYSAYDAASASSGLIQFIVAANLKPFAAKAVLRLDRANVTGEVQRVEQEESAQPPSDSSLSFVIQPELLVRGAWQAFRDPIVDFTRAPSTWSFAPVSGETEETPFTWEPDESLPTFADVVAGLSRGFVRFELTSPPFAFGHREYTGLVAAAVAATLNGSSDVTMPKPPWTPVISAVSLSHSATDTVTLGTAEPGSLRFFQLGPHGFREATDRTDPELIAQQDVRAEFLIGVSGFEGLANLRMLVQLVHGSEDPFAEFPAVSWSCLVGEEWQALTSTAIPRDETSTMRRSGIVEVVVPGEASSTCTWMPSGSIWIRAAAKGNPKAIPRVVGVHSRAATAQRVVNASSTALPVVPLVAKSLSKLAVRERAIKTVEQPYASFGGRAKELEPDFRLRIADRLRHRARAIDVSDFERLVLQEFPQVHRVKCLPHSSRWSSRSPGDVLLVVVPRLDNPHARDPRRPALSQADRTSIESFVRSRCNWLARTPVEVVNATFEQLKVEVEVVLRVGDAGWYESVLAEELQEFFAPWLATTGADIHFGASIHRSEILHFIERRDYVDWVTKLRVLHFVDDQVVADDVELFAPTSERAILVGHPDQDVKALPAGECP